MMVRKLTANKDFTREQAIAISRGIFIMFWVGGTIGFISGVMLSTLTTLLYAGLH